MMVVPKPRRDGGCTGGPPLSFQSITRLEPWSSFQAISTLPVESASAPYLAEFVIISWTTSASVANALGSSATSGPSISMRPARAPR